MVIYVILRFDEDSISVDSRYYSLRKHGKHYILQRYPPHVIHIFTTYSLCVVLSLLSVVKHI